ncbi:hypothetical protein [Amycolatopsis sp. NPDC004079]|uniref:hypothetical protein n=1 Tax=Amycolatopsis sp. NPDC004079 TaxID=3154549 RepID=UPI0033BB7FAC
MTARQRDIAVNTLYAAFGLEDVAEALAPRMSDTESEAMAAFMDAMDDPVHAEIWRREARKK